MEKMFGSLKVITLPFTNNMKWYTQFITSANSLIYGVMVFAKEGVSDTITILGLDVRFRLFTTFLMHFNAACTALTDLKHHKQEFESLIR